MELPISVDRKEVLAENTYILTLDGDIDFQPPAVRCVVYTCLHNTICFMYIIHSFIYLLYLPMYIIINKMYLTNKMSRDILLLRITIESFYY